MTEFSLPVLGVLLFAGGLALVHVFAGRLRLQSIPRSASLSVAGGVSVAYVFVHLLPEVTHRQAELAGGRHTDHLLPPVGEHLLFLVALVGFVGFYGLERLVARSRRTAGHGVVGDGATTRTSAVVFWTHITAFAVYNALIGYHLLHRVALDLVSLSLYAGAMALHFVVNDHGLREHHREAYDHVGRWVLAGGVLVGVAVGFVTPVHEVLLSVLLAFLAGGIILNVIKEELPDERRSDVRAFLAGVAAYAPLLLLV